MQLIWARYQKNNQAYYALFLQLGISKGKFILLKHDATTPTERKFIRQNLTKLSELSLDGRLAWLKSKCPTSYRNAVRSISQQNLHVVKEYKPKGY